MPAPTVTIVLSQTNTPVAMNLPTLKRIEDSTGLTLQEIVDKFNAMIPKERTQDGKPTPEAIAAASRKFSVGLAAAFVAGAADVPLDHIRNRDVVKAFNTLAPAFVDAWNELMGSDEDPKAGKAAPADSPPGSASASGSANQSSPDTEPETLPA